MKKFKKFFKLTLAMLFVCFSLTGCGDSKNSTSGNNKNTTSESVAENIGDAMEDVATGVGNAVNDLVGESGFKTYASAHDYFMSTMGSYHSDAKFEVRDEDRALNDYQEGSKGYHFNLYDTSKNSAGELFGEFFVDATSGLIYKKDKNGKIVEYPGTGNDTNANKTGNTATDPANKEISIENTNGDKENKKTPGDVGRK